MLKLTLIHFFVEISGLKLFFFLKCSTGDGGIDTVYDLNTDDRAPNRPAVKVFFAPS